LSFNDKLIQF